MMGHRGFLDHGACAVGQHWDADSCQCVANACVETVHCILGDHWDSTQCKCVPTPPPPPECATATDCHGLLPNLCQFCPGGGIKCAHWDCDASQCVSAICD